MSILGIPFSFTQFLVLWNRIKSRMGKNGFWVIYKARYYGQPNQRGERSVLFVRKLSSSL